MPQRRPDSEADIGWAAWGCAILVIALILAPVVCSCAYTGPGWKFTGLTIGVAHSEGELEESGSPNNFLSGTHSNAAYAEAHFSPVDADEEARWERQGAILATLAADRASEAREPSVDPGASQGPSEEGWLGATLGTLERHPMGVMVALFLLAGLVALGFRKAITRRLGGDPQESG